MSKKTPKDNMDKVVKKVAKAPVAKKVLKKVKEPKFKLLTYTIKAVIPTGMYANIQPEITVQATSIENAERAVMPHIESLFAKYREGVPQNTQVPIARPPVPVTSTAPVVNSPLAPITPVNTSTSMVPASPAIVMTVPFTRAKSAIESCMSKEALKLVADQVEKSTKLIDSEKAELRTLAGIKDKELTN